MGPAEVVGKLNFGLNCLELVLGAVSVAVVVPWYPVLQMGPVLGGAYGVQILLVGVHFLTVVLHLSDVTLHSNLLLTASILSCVAWLGSGLLVALLFVLTSALGPLNAFLLSAVAALTNAAVHLIDAVRRCRADSHKGNVHAEPCHACLVPIDTSLNYARISDE